MFLKFYKSFFNIVIDSNEKKEAWFKLIELIDDIEEIDTETLFMKSLNNIYKSEDHIKKSGYDMIDFLNDDKMEVNYYGENSNNELR